VPVPHAAEQDPPLTRPSTVPSTFASMPQSAAAVLEAPVPATLPLLPRRVRQVAAVVCPAPVVQNREGSCGPVPSAASSTEQVPRVTE